MRTSLFLIVVGFIAFSSCDEATINVDTEFSKTIVAESTVPVALKSTATVAEYFESDTLDLTDSKDLDEYRDNIQGIDIESLACVFSGIPAGDTIKTFNISIENTELSRSLENVTINNNEYPIPVIALILEAIGTELLNQEKIIINISGTTSAPMTFSVGINIDSKVKAKVLESI